MYTPIKYGAANNPAPDDSASLQQSKCNHSLSYTEPRKETPWSKIAGHLRPSLDKTAVQQRYG
jgi:hypothetical protein